MEAKKHLIHIVGPTASGKTAFSIWLAQHYQTTILSTDSRQFFKEMNIGTAKPDEKELSAAPHFFINNKSVKENYSVGDFEREAIAFITESFKSKDVLITVGGSGLYIKALAEGLDDFPPVTDEINTAWQKRFEEKGLSFLQEELKAKDPKYFEQCDQQNPRRLLRALTVIEASGQAFSHFYNKQEKQRPFQNHYIALDWDRPLLYERINKRVDVMLENGLLEEARNLMPFRTHKALQTVGYQELFKYYDGHIDLEEAIRLIKRNSRRYAKRQMTWFGKNEAIHWLKMPDDLEKIGAKALLYFDKNGILHK